MREGEGSGAERVTHGLVAFPHGLYWLLKEVGA
jgi:hypothetical protein